MHHPNGTNPPANWLPCTPALLESGVNCATAPRWSGADIGPHWHPPVDCPPLVAYYVGDSDIVAAYTPEGALAVFCQQTGQDVDEFTVAEVIPVEAQYLDALQVYNRAEATMETLETTLREDLAALDAPAYLCGWE